MVEKQNPAPDEMAAPLTVVKGPAQAPLQGSAQRLAQIGIERGARRIERNETGLSDAARLHFKKHEDTLRDMVVRSEDWRQYINDNKFTPKSVRDEMIKHMEIIEQCALTGRLVGALATGMKPGEWRRLPEERRQDAIRVARRAAATVQEYAEKNNISVDAAFDTLLKDDKFRGMLVAVGSPAFKAKDDAMRVANGLTTNEAEKRRYMESATAFVAGQARAAGFSETTIKAAFADSTGITAPTGLFGLGEMGGTPQAEAAAAAQAFALATYFQEMWAGIYDKQKANIGREYILAAEEQKNKARARPAEESPQERMKKLEAKDAEVRKLFEDLNRQLGISPAAVAAGSQFDAQPLVTTPMIRKEKKPVDVETQDAPKSSGGTALKVPKAGAKGAERETRNMERDAEARVQPVKAKPAEPKFDADTVGRVAAIKIAMSKLPAIKDPSEHKKALEDIGKMILEAIEAIRAKAQMPSGKQAKA